MPITVNPFEPLPDTSRGPSPASTGRHARNRSRSRILHLLSYFFVEKYYPCGVGKPQCFTVCAFNEVLGIAVGMDIDLDTGGAVANGTLHLVLLCLVISFAPMVISTNVPNENSA